ncbi:MAG: RagB/SusD family nutrient uptake outer membrane protein [Tannerella sp.]|jgi:hypothetical protein|nr:RagB/SusD family nutrient uptake outer membrane protein [Tannerella sp.]
MKRIVFFAVLFAALVSCNELSLVPVSRLTGSNFPLTDNDAIAAVNGVYVANSDFSSSSSYVAELPADAMQCGEEVTSGSGAAIGIYQHDADNGTVTYVWTVLYRGVTNANAAIDNISVSDVSESLKKRLVGEAKFLRALYYFYLVQLFGDVPLVLHPEEGVGVARTPVDEVYTQIVEDLKAASANGVLPVSYDGADKGRVTNGAAWALLAKVYLVWAQVSPGSNAGEKYTQSIAAAGKVAGYELEEDFLDNWNTGKRNGKENIFSAHHVISQESNGDGGNHLAHCSFATGFSDVTPHLIVSDLSFYHKFDDRDQRKGGSFAKRLYNPGKGEYFDFTLPRFRKYIDTLNITTTNLTRSIDRTILRYAEVLLIRAEAQNERDHGPDAESYEAVNQVRRRAFRHFPVTAASADDVPADLSYEQFREVVRDERFFEFVYEQQRWFDLVRWRILVKSAGAVRNEYTDKSAISLRHYRFPIPQSQRNINPEGLWQNWGWDGADESKTGAGPYAGFE